MTFAFAMGLVLGCGLGSALTAVGYYWALNKEKRDQ